MTFVTCLEAAWLALSATRAIKECLPGQHGNKEDAVGTIWKYAADLVAALESADQGLLGNNAEPELRPPEAYSPPAGQQWHWACLVLERLGLSPAAAGAAFGCRSLPEWMGRQPPGSGWNHQCCYS